MTTDKASARRYYSPANRGMLITAIAVLLIMTMLGPMMVYSEAPLTGEGNPVRQGIFALIALLAVIGVRPADWRRLFMVPVSMMIALGWCWLSALWSLDPGITLRRIALTTLVVWTIFISVRQLGYQVVVNLMRASLVIVLIANYGTVLLFPDYGIHQVNEQFDKDLVGDWRGIMQHKNFAGAVSALLIPLLVFDARRIPISLRVAGVAAAAVFLYYSQSKTSLGLVGLAVLTGWAYTRYGPRTRVFLIPGLMLFSAAAILLYNAFRSPLGMIMRDPEAFTGRTVIWRAMLGYVNDHPLLGSGYGAFWNIGDSSPIYTYAEKWVVAVTSGHNGFLDLIVQIGIIGFVIVLVAVVVAPLVRLFASADIPPARGATVIALLIFCIAHNGTESSLFDRDTIVQVFLMFAIALIPAVRAEAELSEKRDLSPFAVLGMRKALS